MKSVLDVGFAQAPTAEFAIRSQFTSQQLIQMAKMQDEANTAMSSSAWLDSTDDDLWYYRAINGELSELSEHIGIKWWKNEHPTTAILQSALEQARMEAVDVLHFSLSYFIRAVHKSRQPLEAAINGMAISTYPNLLRIARFVNSEDSLDYSKITINDFVEQCQYMNMCEAGLPINYVLVLAEMLGMTAEDLYVAYVGKNVLNKFRTANGQRDGSYMKIWNGTEDNEYLTSFLQSHLETNDSPPEVSDLLDYLTKVYSEMLDNNLATRG